MARFAESFIQGLMNPTYQQGLFTAAQSAGSFPRRQREAEEKQRQDKGQMGGILAAQQAASEGRFDPETQKAFMGSMQGLGMSSENLLKILPSLQTANQAGIQKNNEKKIVGYQQEIQEQIKILTETDEPSRAEAAAFYIDDLENKMVELGGASYIGASNTAITQATTNKQKGFLQDYYRGLANYDPSIAVLVDAGQFEAAQARFDALSQKEKEEPSRKVLENFQTQGGIITTDNRTEIWKAVVGTTKDLNTATTMMNRLEEASSRSKAAQHTGNFKKITYIPKATSPDEMQQGLLFGSSGAVQTKTIDAPIDPNTNEIDANWLANFRKHSAKTILELDDPSFKEVPAPYTDYESVFKGNGNEGGGNNTTTPTSPTSPTTPTSPTPNDLARGLRSTVE